MSDVVELLEGETLLSDADELLFRQIAPHMLMDDGKIATTAFGPNTSDSNMPSFSRSSVVTAQDARDWHTENAASPSLGVWGVTVGEVIASRTQAIDDSKRPLSPGSKPRAPGHCFVDFRGLTKAARKDLRALLHMHAMSRGEIPTKATAKDGQLFAGGCADASSVESN